MTGITKNVSDYTFDEVRAHLTGRGAEILDTLSRQNRQSDFMYALNACFIGKLSTSYIQVWLDSDSHDFWRIMGERERVRDLTNMYWR